MKPSQIVTTLFTFVLGVSAAFAHDFSWENLQTASMKLNKQFDYEAHVDGYMQAYRPDLWKRYRDDEFALEEKRVETIELMKKRAEKFSLDEDFVLNVRLDLGKYDFRESRFPIENMTENYYWYASKYSVGDLPGQFTVRFSNVSLLSVIPMSKESANDFVKRNKNSYGQVNRTVSATIWFRLTELKHKDSEFVAEIQSAKIYEDAAKTRLMHEFKKPPAPKKDSNESGVAVKTGTVDSEPAASVEPK